jgi:tRNA-dihydrouridine synthase A
MPIHPANPLVCVAPMMAWTDRHCRYLLRLFSPSSLLFTEMVPTGALVHGAQWHQLDFDPAEQPLALQLGGNDPHHLALCTAEAARRGFNEVNLNVGCPSERVQQGTFGACLMLQPELVAECIAAMRNAADITVSVKCRLGVDQHDSDDALLSFIDTLASSGCQRFYLHARKAILGGLSPAQNRSIPPLQPERVARVKSQRPGLQVIINGGITDLPTATGHLQWADGVMIGRAAYKRPQYLAELERWLFNPNFAPEIADILDDYCRYAHTQVASGHRLGSLTRHLLHACNGLPGARRFRQTLSDSARLKANDLSVLTDARSQVYPQAA